MIWYAAIALFTAALYGRDLVTLNGEIIDVFAAVWLLFMGALWPITLPFFAVHQWRKG